MGDLDYYEKAIKVFQDNGLEIHPSIIRKKVNNVYGLYTTSPILKNTQILKLPKNLIIGLEAEIFCSETINNEFRTVDRLIAHLVYLKSTDACIYRYWFKLLPSLEDFKKTLIFSDIADLLPRVYKGLVTLCTLEQQKRCDNIQKMLKKYNIDVDDDEILWGVLYYQSYGWDVRINPILDLFNHTYASNNYSNHNEEPSILKIHKDHDTGDQIFESYGNRTIGELAIVYGFVPEKTDLHSIFIQALYYTAKPSSYINFAKAALLLNLKLKLIEVKASIIDNNIKITIGKIKVSQSYFDQKQICDLEFHSIVKILSIKTAHDLSIYDTSAMDLLKYYKTLKWLLLDQKDSSVDLAHSFNNYPHIKESIILLNKTLLELTNKCNIKMLELINSNIVI